MLSVKKICRYGRKIQKFKGFTRTSNLAPVAKVSDRTRQYIKEFNLFINNIIILFEV